MARDARYRTYNRLGKTQNHQDMRRVAQQQYHKFALAERQSLAKQGYSREEQRDGPIQRLGAEGYWTIISEMKRDPQLKRSRRD